MRICEITFNKGSKELMSREGFINLDNVFETPIIYINCLQLQITICTIWDTLDNDGMPLSQYQFEEKYNIKKKLSWIWLCLCQNKGVYEIQRTIHVQPLISCLFNW